MFFFLGRAGARLEPRALHRRGADVFASMRTLWLPSMAAPQASSRPASPLGFFFFVFFFHNFLLKKEIVRPRVRHEP